MAKFWNLIILGLLFLGAALSAWGQTEHPSLDPEVAARRAARTKPDFSLKIRAKESAVKVGSPVTIEVTVTNLRDEEITMNTFSKPSMDQIVLRDANGNQCLTQLGKDVAAGKARLTGHSQFFFVQPGNPQLRGFVLSEDFYDLTTPGKYTLQFRVYDEVTKTYVKSNTITFTMT